MILSFALTKEELLSGVKTATRRAFKPLQTARWQRAWDKGNITHEAWDKIPIAKGKRIGTFTLTARPYLEKLADMPPSDLIEEGGMCQSVAEFCKLIGKKESDTVTVIKFLFVPESQEETL